MLTLQKKFFVKDFFSKCDQILIFLWICLGLIKKTNFSFLFPAKDVIVLVTATYRTSFLYHKFEEQ